MGLTDRQRDDLSRLSQRAINTQKDAKLIADAIRATVAADFTAGADLTSVPGSFATLADVQSYLATVIPEIETRLDAIEDALINP